MLNRFSIQIHGSHFCSNHAENHRSRDEAAENPPLLENPLFSHDSQHLNRRRFVMLAAVWLWPLACGGVVFCYTVLVLATALPERHFTFYEYYTPLLNC
jgi:hypothetical protein